jgi:SRSO17 transposase
VPPHVASLHPVGGASGGWRFCPHDLARGDFRALLDSDLYLPKSWADDRPRCRAAGIPDDVRHRSKWRVALDQLIRLGRNGVRFDWVVFDEGYGSDLPHEKWARS